MHWTINTRNQAALRSRGVEAAVIHDTIEFAGGLEDDDRSRVRCALREKFGIAKNDIVLLVGARIVPNKQIEIAGPLVAEIDRQREVLIGKDAPGGERFGADSRVVLVLAGRPERAFEQYRLDLYGLLDGLGICWVYAGDVVRPIRSESHGLYALYPDVYSMADMVVYPTGWEGFGNQLIEAFAAGLPSIVFEYPVYKEDIGPKGFEIVSLGDRLLEERDASGLVQVPHPVIETAAKRALSILSDAHEYRRIAQLNAELGGRHFGPDVLREHLTRSLEWTGTA
jgi:glycosyltransferase involved in cell wall biosynthesis